MIPRPIGGWQNAQTIAQGAVAQLGERLNGIQEVRGSNPLSSTHHRWILSIRGILKTLSSFGGGFFNFWRFT
jgi:hypothetical protein